MANAVPTFGSAYLEGASPRSDTQTAILHELQRQNQHLERLCALQEELLRQQQRMMVVVPTPSRRRSSTTATSTSLEPHQSLREWWSQVVAHWQKLVQDHPVVVDESLGFIPKATPFQRQFYTSIVENGKKSTLHQQHPEVHCWISLLQTWPIDPEGHTLMKVLWDPTLRCPLRVEKKELQAWSATEGWFPLTSELWYQQLAPLFQSCFDELVHWYLDVQLLTTIVNQTLPFHERKAMKEELLKGWQRQLGGIKEGHKIVHERCWLQWQQMIKVTLKQK